MMKPFLLATLLLISPVLAQQPGMTDTDAGQSRVALSSIIVHTPNVKELASFYEKGLQFPPPATVLQNHIGYWLGENYVGFEPADRITQRRGSVTAWFEVRDIHAVYDRLQELGAVAHAEPARQPWGDLHAQLFDPDGNLLGLIETVEAR